MTKKEFKKEWVKALRSGEYDQGQGVLCRIDSYGNAEYCCLGVGYEVMHGPDAWVNPESDQPVDVDLYTQADCETMWEPPYGAGSEPNFDMSMDLVLAEQRSLVEDRVENGMIRISGWSDFPLLNDTLENDFRRDCRSYRGALGRMKIVRRRENHIKEPIEVDCRKCGSTLEVNDNEWEVIRGDRPGDNPSPKVDCPVCRSVVWRPTFDTPYGR